MRFPGFVGPSYTLESVNVDCQRAINIYPRASESGTSKEAERYNYRRTAGLGLLVTIGSGPIRGQWYAKNGVLYVVSANKIYSVSSAWVATERGTLSSSTGVVSMADNGTSLVIVDGTFGYVITLATNAFASITDPDFLGSKRVVFVDGYFIFADPDTQKIYWTDLYTTTFDALDFTSAEGDPDNVVSLIADHRELWVFGEQTTEVMFNSGDANLTFQRVQGAYIEHGCAAAHSPAKINNEVFWLGKDDKGSGIVYKATGYQPQRISTHAVEQAIQSYGNISGAVAHSYQEDGHFFYVLNFSSANTTWVYDTSTGLWHERCYNNQGNLERHRADNHSFAYSTHVVGDYATGKLYALSRDYKTDNSVAIIRQRIAPHLSSSSKKAFHKSFELDIEAGVGLDGIGQGTDPQIMMQYSDDHGHSWSNEKWVSLGAIGQRRQRVLWRRLGSSRDRVYKISYSEPTEFVLIGAELDVEVGQV